MGKTVLPDPGELTGPSRCRRFLTPADEASIFTLDHFPLWYRQAAEQPPGSMVFNLYSAEGPGDLHPKLQGGGAGHPSSHRAWGGKPQRDTGPNVQTSASPHPAGLHLHPGWIVSFPGRQSTTRFKSSAVTKERGLTRKSGGAGF